MTKPPPRKTAPTPALDTRPIRTDLSLLVAAGVVVTVGIAAWAFAAGGPAHLKAALLAAVIASQSVLMAYLVTVLSSTDSAAGPLLGIFLRTGAPMLALLVVREQFPAWMESGFGRYLLACYLPGLAVETCLAARRLSRVHKSSKVSEDSPQAV